MDSDRILLLDAGKIKEFDKPETLLADHSSTFFAMAKDAGLAWLTYYNWWHENSLCIYIK